MTKLMVRPWAMLLGLWVLCLIFLGAASAPTLGETTEHSIAPRSKAVKQCGKSCHSCNNAANTRSLSPLSTRGKQDLVKRVLDNPLNPPWNGNGATYVDDHMILNAVVEITSTRGGEYSIASYHELKDRPFAISMGELSGCIGVVVMSNKGVYISHHPEIGAFSPGDWQIGSQPDFKRLALDELRKGGPQGSHDMAGLGQYAGPNGPFASHYNPAAFIFKRRASGRVKYDKEYDSKVVQLAKEVHTITGVMPKLAKYAMDGDTVDPNVKGQIYFEYDPQGDGCDESQAVARLWMESSTVRAAFWKIR